MASDFEKEIARIILKEIKECPKDLLISWLDVVKRIRELGGTIKPTEEKENK